MNVPLQTRMLARRPSSLRDSASLHLRSVTWSCGLVGVLIVVLIVAQNSPTARIAFSLFFTSTAPSTCCQPGHPLTDWLVTDPPSETLFLSLTITHAKGLTIFALLSA